MLRWRVTGILATLGLLMLGGGAVAGGTAVRPVLSARAVEPARVLQVFYTPPVLVEAGEKVLVPVDVVCATAGGRACQATVSMATRAGAEAWHRVDVPAVKGLRFDLTAPAARALGSGRTGRVEFYLSARDAAGRVTSLGSASAPLSFSVVRDLPRLKVAAIPFGDVRHGSSVLSLPWGSGDMRAGLRVGIEAASLGPSSFDVDGAGRIYLSDSSQDRVAVFRGGRLERQTTIAVSARADIAVGESGGVSVADGERGILTVRTIGSSGGLVRTESMGAASGWQIDAIGGQAFVNSLPMDAWIPVDAAAGRPVQGMPASSGVRVLRLGTERSVRIATVRDGTVQRAVEISSDVRFGEVALADVDGAGGFVVVVHTWRVEPTPADQYQVIHIRNGRVVQTFAVANATFTETPPLSRFRLGPDGAVYHLVTTPVGVSIDRYSLTAAAP